MIEIWLLSESKIILSASPNGVVQKENLAFPTDSQITLQSMFLQNF